MVIQHALMMDLGWYTHNEGSKTMCEYEATVSRSLLEESAESSSMNAHALAKRGVELKPLKRAEAQSFS